MINKKQFDILVYLEKSRIPLSQREIAKEIKRSVGSVNKSVSELNTLGLIETNNVITEKGLEALEIYKVKRMIFLAAGFGSRLVPITLNTPKPLIKVCGNRIIDSLIDAALAVEIKEIYVVRGYLAEQFEQLKHKYPMIKFIDNPSYNESNNISSALFAGDLLANAYVCEADLLLYNPNLISKYQYSSNYLGVPVEKSDDWCMFCENGRINKFTLGGEHCFHMFGISYWTFEDGERLKGHIKDVYNSPGGKERYWDQVALEYYVKEYNIAVRECTFEDVIEIDTFRELKNIDKSYET